MDDDNGSKIFSPKTRRLFISEHDLNAAAERLAAISRWVMDSEGRAVMTPSSSLEADMEAAKHQILGFIASKNGAVIEKTHMQHPAGALHRRPL